ncbi:hypothetical protein FO519_000678 [Halicephalobus sp. NKZ332]|nr:hypothetical protein FO519_000678 [Halicephalobus sp. NKZ332]
MIHMPYFLENIYKRGSFWLRYGFLKYDLTMITVNVVGVSLMLIYIVFYICYTSEKKLILVHFGMVSSLIAAMFLVVQMYGMSVINYLGFVCMSFNILNFGAPLAGVKVVFRKKCCDSLPLPLCTANLLVSSQWCTYGILVEDIYIIHWQETGRKHGAEHIIRGVTIKFNYHNLYWHYMDFDIAHVTLVGRS